jgi:hypothetical protein
MPARRGVSEIRKTAAVQFCDRVISASLGGAAPADFRLKNRRGGRRPKWREACFIR